MLRILLNAATVLSLVLCAETVPVWVRSYRASDAVVLLGFGLDYFPYWFILLLTAILPAVRLTGWRRRRARRLRMCAGLCQHCGYDCRATPDRCPECGRVGPRVAAEVAESG